MVQEVKDAIQVLRYIKSLKGNYRGFAQHTNSKDIHIITGVLVIFTVFTGLFKLFSDQILLY